MGAFRRRKLGEMLSKRCAQQKRELDFDQ